MTILTDQEIHAADPAPHERFDQERIDFARAIEQAVIRKLATVSVEPVAWLDEEFDMAYTASELAGEPTDPTMFPALYPPEAIAAARVQALEEAAKVCECQWSTLEERDAGIEYAEAIRALIGGLE